EVAFETELLSTLFVQIDAVVTESGNNCRAVVTDITRRKQSEIKLAEVTQRLEALMAAVPVGISYSEDSICQRITGNPAALKQFNVSEQDNLSASALDHDAPCRKVKFFLDDREITDAELPLQRAVSENNIIPPMELKVVMPSGRQWFAKASGAPVRDEQGNVIGGIVVTEDITARKQAEEALRQQTEASLRLSEQGFLSLEAMPQIVWATLPDGRNIYFNQQWVDYTGLTMEESYGHGWNIPFHPDDKQQAWDAWQRATQHNERYSLECRLRRADGVYKWWLIRGEPMLGANGEILKWFGTCTDIEELKHAETVLNEANDLLEQRVNERTTALTEARNALELERDILQAVMNGAKNSHLVYLDRDFNFVCVNEAYARTCGYQPEQMIGKNHFDLYPNAENESIFARVRDTGEMAAYHDKPFEFPDQPERGVTYWDWTLTPIKGSLGQVAGLVFSLFETTERKLSEENLKIALEGVQRYSGKTDAILSSMLDAVLVYNVDMNVVRVNPGFYSVYGFDPIGMNIREIIVKTHCRNHDGTPLSFDQQPTPRALMGEKVLNRLFIITRLDGQERILETSSSPMFIGEQIAGSVTVWHDITERKQAEERQRESQERLTLAADAGQVGMFDLNMATGDLQWTQQHEVIFGYDPTTTTRTYRDWADRVHPEDLPMVEGRMRQGMEDRDPFQIEYRLVWPDNSLHWVNVTSKYYFDDSGRCTRLMGAVRDITNQKMAEDALKRSEAMYRSIGESIDYGVWICAPDGRNTYVSESFLKMVGITQKQCSDFGWGDVLHPDDAERTIAVWQECVRTGSTWDIEHRFRGTDGQWHHVLARGVPVRNEQGDVISWAGINLDISRLKQAEEELKNLNAELDNLVKQRTAELREKDQVLVLQSRQAAMGEMIANISHQWRQPLNILGMQLQQLQLFYDLGQFNKELLEKNVSGSMEIIQHMSKTIDDFRNYFKPDKEKIEFNVHESIRTSLSLLEGSLKNPLIEVEVVANDDPAIYGFPNEFAQVVLNIMNNARDVFIERNVSKPKVNINICSEGGCVVVTVADNAGGISEDIINRVFDPYFTTKGPQQGTGVGLFMSKAIIEKNMGGRLNVRNIADGAEFRIEV
ncbi:MAG: PAS domain S-box protein, partial [Pedobacter sp.]